MHITIEQNQVIVNLDETEFPIFETMFANLQGDKRVSLEFRKFPDFGGSFTWTFAPMHLCRVIGEGRHAPTGDWPRRFATRQDFVYRSESAKPLSTNISGIAGSRSARAKIYR